MRSYAFAARFIAQSRVLLLAQEWTPGIDHLLASDPWLLWIPTGVRQGDALSWQNALACVSAMPSASVDCIIWLQDESFEQSQDASAWVVECSRILDRNGTVLIRQARPKARPMGLEPPDQFWALADRMHAEFPWVEIAAEVNWGASSVTPVQEPEGGFLPLCVSSELVAHEQTQSEAYWCLCALRKEDTQNWNRPTLILQEASDVGAQTFWAKKEQVEQHCKDAAKLMTAQRRIGSLRARIQEMAQEAELWEQKEKPDLLCKMVELQDRTQWLREQVVELEQRSVQSIEAKTRLEAELQKALGVQQSQDKTIRELKARLAALAQVAAQGSEAKSSEAAPEPGPVEEPAMALLVTQPEPEPEPEPLLLDTPIQAAEPAVTPRVQALALSLDSVPPDDHRVLAMPPMPKGWSVEAWTEKVRTQRSKLGAQAPEFVTRPLNSPRSEPE